MEGLIEGVVDSTTVSQLVYDDNDDDDDDEDEGSNWSYLARLLDLHAHSLARSFARKSSGTKHVVLIHPQEVNR